MKEADKDVVMASSPPGDMICNEDNPTPRPHKCVSTHKTQIGEEPFRTSLVLARKNLKYHAVNRIKDTEEEAEEDKLDHSEPENSKTGDVHKELGRQ